MSSILEKGQHDSGGVLRSDRTDLLGFVHRPVSSKYYINDLINKRGLEDLHVILWMLKDFSWIRCWHQNLVGTIGGIAIAISLVITISDSREIIRSRSRPKSVLYESIKECINSLICLLWLSGNVWWAYGETWDLRTTAGYNDIYEQYSGQSAYMLYSSGLLGAVFWFVNSSIETFGLSKNMYDLRLVRTAHHNVLADKAVPFHVPNINRGSSFENLALEVEESVHQDDLCAPVPNSTAVNTHSEMLIAGLPYVTMWPIGVPAGRESFRTGVSKSKFRFAPGGLFSFRDLENILVWFWVIKDVSWLNEEPLWAKVCWVVFGVLALCSAVRGCLLLIQYFKTCHVYLVDLVHSIASVLWILCNFIWGYGEVFVTDEVPGLSEDVNEAFHFLIPDLFTPSSELPPDAWYYRFIAAWTLMISIWLLLGMYIFFIVMDTRTFLKSKKNKSANAAL